MNLLQQIANSLRNLHQRQTDTELLLHAAEVRGLNLGLRLEYLEDRLIMAEEIMSDLLRMAERGAPQTIRDEWVIAAAREYLGQ